MNLSLVSLKKYLKTHLTHCEEVGSLPLTVNQIVTDSRCVVPGSLFVALRGERFDAHDFLEEVIHLGAAAVVIEHFSHWDIATLPLPALHVANTRMALGQIAKYWRQAWEKKPGVEQALPVIAVTGSNGKTTVKAMIASILTAALGENHFLATIGNENNDIGVPKTLFRLTQAHKAAVLELGMNHPGEIAYLSDMVLPTVALVNNAQREHQEFMQSVQAVADENGAVIAHLPLDGVAIFPAHHPYSAVWEGLAGKRRKLTFCLRNQLDESVAIPAEVIGFFKPNAFGGVLQVQSKEASFEVTLQVAGLHNAHNALAAIAATLAVGCADEDIKKGLHAFRGVAGRLEQKRAKQGATIIDDTYNANPDSVLAAIDVLAQCQGKKIVVLGDMAEVGDEGIAYHLEVGAYAKKQGIDALLTLGQLSRHTKDAFGENAEHFNQIETLLSHLDVWMNPNVTVLIKGSRSMKMERVVAHLLAQACVEDV